MTTKPTGAECVPPYPRPRGQQPKAHIQAGAQAYLRHRQEEGGKLSKAEWRELARETYPAYRTAKSNWRRESLLKTFQNSVYKAAGRLAEAKDELIPEYRR